MQSTYPRSFLLPQQVGLGVMLEHKYGHRDLLDMINRFGVCSSYTQASKYRTNAATVQGVDVIGDIEDVFVQFQSDNVDHASRTLDGYGSINVMCQMATFTPAVKAKRVVSRLTADMRDHKDIAHVQIVSQKDSSPIQPKK